MGPADSEGRRCGLGRAINRLKSIYFCKSRLFTPIGLESPRGVRGSWIRIPRTSMENIQGLVSVVWIMASAEAQSPDVSYVSHSAHAKREEHVPPLAIERCY